MPPLSDDARAKVNLTLRVVGRRVDGYHDLESVVAFCDCADRLTLKPGAKLKLTITGPRASDCGEAADNLVQRSETIQRERFIEQALAAALEVLSKEDALLVKMHFIEGLSVADVARSLALPQKPLYRRLDRALALLRRELERRGVTREEYLAVFTER